MSKLQPVVTLPEAWVDKAYLWGEDFVAHRQRMAERGLIQRSVPLTEMDIDKDPQAQARWKMAEAAAAIAFGYHPAVVNWSLIPDPGFDFVYKNLGIDVKSSDWGDRYLIWPRKKNDIYPQCAFDLLLSVQIDVPRFCLKGYVSKTYFGAHHQVAGDHHRLLPGTWYMEDDELWDLHMLLGSNPPSRWRSIISSWDPAPSAASTAT